MRVLDSNGSYIWAWTLVQANVNVILIENASRSQYKKSIHEKSSIKLTFRADCGIIKSAKSVTGTYLLF